MLKPTLALVLLASCGAAALQADAPKAGEKELGLQFNYSNLDTGTSSSPNIESTQLKASYGYLLTDHHEIGGFLGYTSQKVYQTASTTAFGVAYSYNFQIGKETTPYLGAHAAFLSSSLPNGALADYKNYYGLEAGLKVYPWDHAGFTFAATWDTYVKDHAPDNGTQFALVVGLGLKW
ncbi:MAG TPA: outer membrane beta-barrel protein [Holophagaceae bacterium]